DDAPRAEASAALPVAAPARDETGADDLRRYRLALKASAERLKRYPPLAREQGWEGSVEIALDFRPPAAEPELSLAASSGKKILDEQALETLRQAVRRTDLPESLKGRDFRILQVVSFNLEDEGSR
ncbi:MAG: energy transducer TonB, partial [Candidatus Accumulibacter sp.]|nr:energy transducer TonB [Accumulibacter sp.]